ncbi:hypothetical protein QYE76_004432 [Lolium multiflorum]|uniref:Retrotransposon gag domain-containing protein n=1 Tax=Lolium multiflorum TaxID=4521 RepID=A0AAD8RT71_LOLMU|nr:hypothetical protein QYE76_004432 [Lolium multiflorum]
MSDEPVKYEDLPEEHKKKYDELKAVFEADLIGSFEKTRSHGIRFKGFTPEGVLEGLDLSLPSEERTRALRQEVNYMVAHSLHRHSESLVNAFERVALRVVQEIMKHQYSPSGPALGTHQGEIPLHTKSQLPFTFAAPQQQGSPAYVVYKVGGGSSGADVEKQAWLAKYATGTSHESSTPAAHTVDQISAILRDQFGILPKKRTIGYSKPYPNEFDLIPLPPKYRLPDFTKFSGAEGSSSIEHVSRYLAQLGMVSASDQRVRQRRGETVSEYIQRFRTVKNRCYSVRLSEKEAVELAVAGLAAPLKDLTFQVEYNSLAHMVQKLTSYEQRHPELYQDKFKRPIGLVEAEEVEDPAEDQEVAVAEWTRVAVPVSCKWVKQPGPAKGFDFDISKTEQIFDLLLKEKQLKLPEGHKIPAAQELNGRPYCKWHHTFTHATNDCKVLRGQIQMAIEQGRLIFGQFAMKVDTQPFPGVNLVELNHATKRQPGFSFGINMAGLVNCHGKDKAESSHSRGQDKEEADPRDRPQYDDRRYLTEEEVRSVRYQRPLSAHLLNKYEHQDDRHRRYDMDDERYRRSDADNRKYHRYDSDDERYERHAKGRSREQEDVDRHWDCPFFKHCWDSGMSRLPTIDNCPECRQQRKGTNEVSVFKRLGPLPRQSRRAESSRDEDVEESEDEEEDRYHRPRWCPDGLSHSQKRRVQRLRNLEESEAQYLYTLRKARPDLAAKIQQTLKTETPAKESVAPKQTKARAGIG